MGCCVSLLCCRYCRTHLCLTGGGELSEKTEKASPSVFIEPKKNDVVDHTVQVHRMPSAQVRTESKSCQPQPVSQYLSKIYQMKRISDSSDSDEQEPITRLTFGNNVAESKIVKVKASNPETVDDASIPDIEKRCYSDVAKTSATQFGLPVVSPTPYQVSPPRRLTTVFDVNKTTTNFDDGKLYPSENPSLPLTNFPTNVFERVNVAESKIVELTASKPETVDDASIPDIERRCCSDVAKISDTQFGLPVMSPMPYQLSPPRRLTTVYDVIKTTTNFDDGKPYPSENPSLPLTNYPTNVFELVITLSRSCENLLELEFGAVGRGLHEKVSSVQENLTPSLIKKLRFLASVRNKLVHRDQPQSFPGPEKYIEVYEQARKELETVLNGGAAVTQSGKTKKKPNMPNSLNPKRAFSKPSSTAAMPSSKKR